MKQRPRIYYTEEQKAMMWNRWQKGETLKFSRLISLVVFATQCVGLIVNNCSTIIDQVDEGLSYY